MAGRVRLATLLKLAGKTDESTSGGDDRHISGAQFLPCAVHDPPHALCDGAVLVMDTMNSRVILGALALTIEPVVIVAIGLWSPGIDDGAIAELERAAGAGWR